MWGEILKIWRAQLLDVYCGIMKKKKMMENIAQRKTVRTENEPISISQMTFHNSLGPNGTVITLVSGKAGRE